MHQPRHGDYLVLAGGDLTPIDRGSGVMTLPYLGRWNNQVAQLTSGITVFEPHTQVQLHTHNVEEAILVLEGQPTAVIAGTAYELTAGDSTWIPPGAEHHFLNRSETFARIYWVYGGREVTRTICATGETVEHLSLRDRNPASG